MAVKVLVFGDNANSIKLLSLLKGDRPATDEDIQVDNVKVQGKSFLIFTIKEMTLVSSQAAGVGALIYFIGEGPIYQSRNNLLQLLSQSRELEGIPLIIALDASNKSMNIKDVISELELFKIKDRASMVKEIDFKAPSSVNDMFEWAETQANRTNLMFDAQPRVVKAKPKYREDVRPNQKTYEDLMKDKKFRGLSSIDQQQKYLNLELERIKENSMQTQLANFNKNKKKMTPYEIKPAANPRIQPNLNFFLKDSQNEKPQQVNIKIQTDEFKPKPPEPQYVPKKTGVDSSTQVQQNQLFDFDRQVQPILNVLIMKTLEVSSLEIQEEQQIMKMAKYKEMYNEKRKKEKQHYKQQLKAEEQRIKAKDQLLKKHRQKQQSKKQCFKKVQAYKIAGNFLNKIHADVVDGLHHHGLFPNNFQNQLQTNYVDFLMKNTMVSLSNLKKKSNDISGLFDKDCISQLVSQCRKPHETVKAIKKKAEERRVNMSQDMRSIVIYYEHKPCFISNFARYLSKYCDKSLQEYNKNQSQKLKELQTKLAQGEITDEVITKTKNDDLAELTKNLQGMHLMSYDPIVFAIGHNQFEKTNQRKVEIITIVINKHGDVVQNQIVGESSKLKDSTIFTYDGMLRDARKPVNMDEGVIVDLSHPREDGTTIIFGLRLDDVLQYTKPQNQLAVKYLSYGLEYYKTALPISKLSLSTIKVEELGKQPQNPDDPQPKQAALILAYALSYRSQFGGWYLETLNSVVKALNEQQEANFIGQIGQFYKTSLGTDREELGDEEEQPELPKSAPRKSRQDIMKEKKKKGGKAPEPEPTKKIHLSSRCLPPKTIKFDDGSSIMQDLVVDVQSFFPEFIQSAQFGWQFRLRGKPLQNAESLKKFKKTGDLEIVRKPQVIVQVETNEKVDQEGSKNAQQPPQDD